MHCKIRNADILQSFAALFSSFDSFLHLGRQLVDRIKVSQFAALPQKRAVICEEGALSVALCRVGDDVYAFEAVCPHAFKSLKGARVRGETLMCPHHGARFDLKTGALVASPAVTNINTYKVAVDGDDVFIVLDE